MQEMDEQAPRSEWIEGRQAMQTPEASRAEILRGEAHMGEARRRKATDPTFGKSNEPPPRPPAPVDTVPVLQPGERGLVVCAPIEISTVGTPYLDGRFEVTRRASYTTRGSGRDIRNFGQLDLQELRFSLLFWDRFAWPSAKNIDPAFERESAEATLLTSEGRLG